MGYVQSASTVTLRARLTQLGREELLSGTTQITVKYFALGDGDANYRTPLILSPGKVPDVTGDYSGCTLSLADGAGLHYPLPSDEDTPGDDIVPEVTTTTKKLLFCCGSPSLISLSGNNLVCIVNVNKLMNAENKILYEWYSNAQNADVGTFATLSLGGAPTQEQSIPGSKTSPIQFSGTNNGTAVVLSGEPYANFYDFLCVNERIETNGVVTNVQTYDDIEFEFASSVDRYLWELINNIIIYKNDSVYNYLSSNGYYTDYTNIIRTLGEQPEEVNNTAKNSITDDVREMPSSLLPFSPMITSFSSLDVNKIPLSDTLLGPAAATISSGIHNLNHLVGAGPGGLLVSAREMGYYCEYIDGDTNTLAPIRGFVPTLMVENGYKSNYSDHDGDTNGIYSAIRIKEDMIINVNRTAGTQDKYVTTKDPGSMEHVFIYDAFSGYDLADNYDPTNNPTPHYSKFYDGTNNRGNFVTQFTAGDAIYTIEKLKWDPFHPKRQNPNGVRGFSTHNYTPSEYELSQMAAFDHIITQGRLLRLTTDPYIDYLLSSTSGTANYVNPYFGSVGDGGIAPTGVIYGTKTVSGNYEGGDVFGDSVNASRTFTFNTTNNSISYLKSLTNNLNNYWQASFQHNNLFGYGLTLLNYERAKCDVFFSTIFGAFTDKGTEGKAPPNIAKLFNHNVDKKQDEYQIVIKMTAKTKNIKNNNGTPYTAGLTLIFKNTYLKDDIKNGKVPTMPADKGWGYIDNIHPIIERTATM